jgi:hemolysin activation/secretion protein
MAPLVGRPRLTSADMERVLTLAGRVPGLTLRSTLAAGTRAGGSVLVLEADHELVMGSYSLDNRLSDTLGPWQATLQARLNQPLGYGEQAYVYVGGQPNPVRMLRSDATRRVAGGGVIVPLGYDGLSLNLEYTWSDTKSPGSAFVPETQSRFERTTLRLSYPLVLTREREVTVTGTLDASSQSNTAPAFAFRFNADRLRVARLGVDASSAIGEQGRLRLTGLFSRGLSGLGARSTGDAAASNVPLSRPGAGPEFTKVEAGAAWDQVLPYGMQSRTSVRMQRAFGAPLPSAELFSLDGEDALSSFDSGTLSDDGGWTLRQELGRQFAAEIAGAALPVQPYLFLAAGRNASRSGAPEGTSTAAGAGVRTNFKAVSLALEYGRGRIRPGGGDQTKLFAKAQVAF